MVLSRHMGLDIVELIMAVEDGFKIHIEDAEASRASTAGDLYELVMSKVRSGGTRRCLTSAAFYRTRRGICEALGVDRREIRPSTELKPMLPEGSRRERWHAVQNVIGLKLPPLGYGETVGDFAVAGLFLGMGVSVSVHAGFAAILASAVVGSILGLTALRFAPGFAVVLPNGEVTVGDLARDVLALNHAQFAADAGGWNDRDVWETLCRILAHQTGIEPSEIGREDRILDDLGIC